MKTLKRLALLLAVGLSTSGFAQNYLGVHSSNYGGVMERISNLRASWMDDLR